jgi:hypothetical protein
MDRRIEESPAMTIGYFLGRYIDVGIKAMICISLVKWSGLLN